MVKKQYLVLLCFFPFLSLLLLTAFILIAVLVSIWHFGNKVCTHIKIHKFFTMAVHLHHHANIIPVALAVAPYSDRFQPTETSSSTLSSRTGLILDGEAEGETGRVLIQGKGKADAGVLTREYSEKMVHFEERDLHCDDVSVCSKEPSAMSVRSYAASISAISVSAKSVSGSMTDYLGHMAVNTRCAEGTVWCTICLEHVPPFAVFRTATCGCGFCRSCMVQYCVSKIHSGGALDIDCPDCHQPLTADVIRPILDPAEQERYDRYVRIGLVNRNPNARWCPTPDCNTPVYRPPTADTNLLVCTKCQVVFCFECSGPWHEGETCGESVNRRLSEGLGRAEEKAFSKWAQREARRCPTCRVHIEKVTDGACNHMVCSQCHTEFCWLCGQKIPPEGHFDPNNFMGCPGMQFGVEKLSRKDKVLVRARVFLRRTGKTSKKVLVVGGKAATFVLLAPFVLALSLPVVAVYATSQLQQRQQRARHREETEREPDSPNLMRRDYTPDQAAFFML